MINRDSSLREITFEVCTALDNKGLRVVLVGGSAATFYAPQVYQSHDLDFIARFAVDDERENNVIDVLAGLGYELSGNTFIHKHGNPFTIEFPKGPASALLLLERPHGAVGGGWGRAGATVQGPTRIDKVLGCQNCRRGQSRVSRHINEGPPISRGG